MAHEHHHHHHHHATNANTKVILAGALINLLFVFIEAGVGLWQNSLSLLSDAGHNLSDVFSLLLVLIAIRLTQVHQSEHYTYGYKKSSILISLLNAVLLLGAVGQPVSVSSSMEQQPYS